MDAPEFQWIDLPELLEMRGGPAYVTAQAGMKMRDEALDLARKSNQLIADAEQLQRCARDCHSSMMAHNAKTHAT